MKLQLNQWNSKKTHIDLRTNPQSMNKQKQQGRNDSNSFVPNMLITLQMLVEHQKLRQDRESSTERRLLNIASKHKKVKMNFVSIGSQPKA